MNPLFAELANVVITAGVPIIGGFVVTYAVKAYNEFRSWTGMSKVTLTAQQQSADNATIQSALSNVAQGVVTDIAAGKVTLSVPSLEAEALARVSQVQAKVPDAIARAGVAAPALATSLLSHIAAATLPAPQAAAVTALAPAIADAAVPVISADLTKLVSGIKL
jgi:preprotein translocase subunit SecF